MRVVERGQAAVSERRIGAQYPGAGPHHGRVPAERGEPRVERAGHRDRVVLAAERRAGGDVARQQAALAQDPHVARQRTGEGAARRLHVSEPRPRALLRQRPRHTRELGVQRDDSHGAVQGQFEVRSLLLRGVDRVLERRVVELHDVRGLGAVRG